MNHIRAYIFVTLCFCLFTYNGFSQIKKSNPADSSVYIGDQVVIRLGEHVGEIQWQKSFDKENWVNIDGANADTLAFIADTLCYFRAEVIAGICEPFYSDIIEIKPIKAEDIIAQIADEILPPDFSLLLQEEMFELSGDPEYEEYVNDLMSVLISLRDSIELYHSVEDFLQVLEQFRIDFDSGENNGFNPSDNDLDSLPLKSNSLGCQIVNQRLGYAKGITVDMNIGIGVMVYNSLSIMQGGGAEIIYDFVNQTSQVYIFTICGSSVSIEAGLAGAMGLSLGFSGHSTWLLNIPDYSTFDLFAGPSRTSSIGLSLDVAKGLGIGIDITVGTTVDVDYDKYDFANLVTCPGLLDAPEKQNGITGYTFSVGAHLNIGLEFSATLSGSLMGANHTGIRDTYTDYKASSKTKKNAALKMAASVIYKSPIPGTMTALSPIDLIAAAAAIVYGFNDLNECNSWDKPSLITKDYVGVVYGPNGVYNAGGIILDNGGKEIIRKGIAVRKASNGLNWEMFFPSQSPGDDFNVDIYPLEPSQKYIIAAYADNQFGRGWGNEFEFTTIAAGDGLPCPGTPTVTDIEGNIYNTVKIGDQCWLKENLRVTKYNDGAAIPNVTSASEWKELSTPAYAWYNNSRQTWGNNYGALYNYYTINTGKLCPAGWKIPTDEDWIDLELYLGMSEEQANSAGFRGTIEGNLLKSCRQVNSPLGESCATTAHPRWDSHSSQFGTDAFGFSAFPAGYRLSHGVDTLVAQSSIFWAPTISGLHMYRSLSYSRNNIRRAAYDKNAGFSVRCIQGNETIKKPNVSTANVSEISHNAAKSGGIVTSDGGSNITVRGIVWSIYESFSIEFNDGFTQDGPGLGSFSSNLSGLMPLTKYYVRAYATNSAGTGYGNTIEFTTNIVNTEVKDVFNPLTGQVWMDRNLGATRAATSSTDVEAYGDLYQWGRAADGHQIRNSPTTPTLSSSDTPGHGNFILAPDFPYDWRSPQNDNLWQGVNGVNNPCPPGYRVPTEIELNTERLSWSTNNAGGAFNSPLKLPLSGYRDYQTGSPDNVGFWGLYWSCTLDGSNARRLGFDNTGVNIRSTDRVGGRSVRCIKEEFSSCVTPGTPTNLQANVTGQITATLTWSAGSPAGSPTVTYYWEVRTTAGNVVGSGSTEATTAGVTALTAGTTYNFRVRAQTSCDGSYSNWSGNSQNFTLSTSGTAVVDVFNPATGKTWMDRNLGASRAATSSTDVEAYGDLYQWGRAADGHQIRNSPTTTTLSSSDTPGHGNFITAGSGSNYDWRSPQNTNLWQGVNGTNNPCPPGYKLPTEAELNAERLSWSSNNSAGAFASPLKLPVAGYRDLSNGSLGLVGYTGYYWWSTAGGTGSRGLYFSSSDAYMYSGGRAYGASVRCLKD